jgi:hypothetical protein
MICWTVIQPTATLALDVNLFEILSIGVDAGRHILDSFFTFYSLST